MGGAVWLDCCHLPAPPGSRCVCVCMCLCVCVCACVCVRVLTQLTQFKLSHGHLLVHCIVNHPFHPIIMCICVYTYILWHAKIHANSFIPSPRSPSIGPYSVTVTWDPPTDDGGTPTARQFYRGKYPLFTIYSIPAI